MTTVKASVRSASPGPLRRRYSRPRAKGNRGAAGFARRGRGENVATGGGRRTRLSEGISDVGRAPPIEAETRADPSRTAIVTRRSVISVTSAMFGIGAGVRSAISLARRPIWREQMAWVEFATLLSDPHFRRPRGAKAARPVLLIPGLLSGDVHLTVMRRWLEQNGHVTEAAGMRLNVDCSETAVARLQERLESFAERQGKRVVLIGQSRGGLFARVLAVRRPDLVNSVITLGSPHADPMRVHPLLLAQGASLALAGSFGLPGVFRHACRTGECCGRFRSDLSAPFPGSIGFFSLYSKTDGIVDWQACLDDAATPIEIDSTHCGMGVNPMTYRFLDHYLNRQPLETRLPRANAAQGALRRAA
jgi:pimeloyl-ACP methyl ester carboxylesterase